MSNYKLREMISGLKYICAQHMVSWTAMHSMRLDPPERIAKEQAANQVAHTVAADVMRRGTWQVTAKPEGNVYSVNGYWLTYDELYRLMEDAYSMGRLERPALDTSALPCPGQRQVDTPTNGTIPASSAHA